MMQQHFSYDFPTGTITIHADNNFITGIDFGYQLGGVETPLIKEAKKQLSEYFNRKRKIFDLPLNPQGSDFQKRVWQALQNIPYGQTRCYADIAGAIGRPKACRAVGGANNKNPISIVIPCHRVIGKNGDLVGYGGGLAIKTQLLNLEKTIK